MIPQKTGRIQRHKTGPVPGRLGARVTLLRETFGLLLVVGVVVDCSGDNRSLTMRNTGDSNGR